jgi:hypothetical protein
MCYNTIRFNQTIILSPLVFLMQFFWFFNFSPPWGGHLALLSYELSNQLSKLHDVPSFLSFMRIWAFQGLWDLSEIQASCLFTLVMFISWFLGATYFSCSSSSWFHDPQASCLFTFVMFISWFLGTTLFSRSSSWWFHDPHELLLFVACKYVGKSNTPPNLVVVIFFLVFCNS